MFYWLAQWFSNLFEPLPNSDYFLLPQIFRIDRSFWTTLRVLVPHCLQRIAYYPWGYFTPSLGTTELVQPAFWHLKSKDIRLLNELAARPSKCYIAAMLYMLASSGHHKVDCMCTRLGIITQYYHILCEHGKLRGTATICASCNRYKSKTPYKFN